MEVLDLLQRLIRRPSVTPDDAGCQEIVDVRLTAAGFGVERLRFGQVDNLWATHGRGAPLICLAGHTDVVPPGPLDAWTSSPFEPVVREGKLYGRGASDMKASVAAMVVALERIAREGHHGTVALLLTSDEEGPGIDGTNRTLEELSRRGVLIDGAIGGEPTSEVVFGDAIKHGRRGSMSGAVTVQGLQGHTAYPQLAVNAIHKIAPALGALCALQWNEPEGDFPPTTLQISNVFGGTGAGNVIPGRCEVHFNIRFGTGLSVPDIKQSVGQTVRDCGIFEPIAWNVSALPFITGPGPLVQVLESAIQVTLGTSPHKSTGGGTSDARFFAAYGIPVVEFGPLNTTIHAIDECVDVADLESLARVYQCALDQLMTCSAT